MSSPRLLATAIALLAFGLVAARPCAGQSGKGDGYSADERGHWSLLPRAQAVPPGLEAADAGRAANPVDSFILVRLKQAGLSPAPPADRRTLVRRAYFNLI